MAPWLRDLLAPNGEPQEPYIHEHLTMHIPTVLVMNKTVVNRALIPLNRHLRNIAVNLGFPMPDSGAEAEAAVAVGGGGAVDTSAAACGADPSADSAAAADPSADAADPSADAAADAAAGAASNGTPPTNSERPSKKAKFDNEDSKTKKPKTPHPKCHIFIDHVSTPCLPHPPSSSEMVDQKMPTHVKAHLILHLSESVLANRLYYSREQFVTIMKQHIGFIEAELQRLADRDPEGEWVRVTVREWVRGVREGEEEEESEGEGGRRGGRERERDGERDVVRDVVDKMEVDEDDGDDDDEGDVKKEEEEVELRRRRRFVDLAAAAAAAAADGQLDGVAERRPRKRNRKIVLEEDEMEVDNESTMMEVDGGNVKMEVDPDAMDMEE